MFNTEMTRLVAQWNAKLAPESARLAGVAPESENICALHFALAPKEHYNMTGEFDVHLVQTTTGKCLATTFIKTRKYGTSVRTEIDLLTISPAMYGLGLTSMTFALTILLLAHADFPTPIVMLNAITVGTLFVLAPYNPSSYNVEMHGKRAYDYPPAGDILQAAKYLAKLPSGAFSNVEVILPVNKQTTTIAAQQLHKRIYGPKMRTVCDRSLRKARVKRLSAQSIAEAKPNSAQAVKLKLLIRLCEYPVDHGYMFFDIARELVSLHRQHLTLLASLLAEMEGSAIGVVMARLCKALVSSMQTDLVERQEARNAVVRFTVDFAQALDNSDTSAVCIQRWVRRLDDDGANKVLKRAQKALALLKKDDRSPNLQLIVSELSAKVTPQLAVSTTLDAGLWTSKKSAFARSLSARSLSARSFSSLSASNSHKKRGSSSKKQLVLSGKRRLASPRKRQDVRKSIKKWFPSLRRRAFRSAQKLFRQKHSATSARKARIAAATKHRAFRSARRHR